MTVSESVNQLVKQCLACGRRYSNICEGGGERSQESRQEKEIHLRFPPFAIAPLSFHPPPPLQKLVGV